MKAMIFAAGLGTRLKPITDSIPKALLPINEKPLIQHVIEKLISNGFDEIIINVHHFADQIIDFLNSKNRFNIRIEISDETDVLLDTGGGIRKASWFFDDEKPFLVHNVDILSNANLKNIYKRHLKSNSDATLIVSNRNTVRYLLFDGSFCLKGWINEKTGETKPLNFINSTNYNKLAFSGIQVLSPSVFKLMDIFEAKFPILDFYLQSMDKITILGINPKDFKMLDVGKIDILNDANVFAKNNP